MSTSSAQRRPPRGASARVTKRRAEPRATLMEAAFRVFADKGFGQVRIEDVCTAAGYTRGAFYSNFDSLEELFFTLYDASARLTAGQVTDALTARDINPGLEAVIERVTATLLLNRDWLLIKTDFLLHAARNPAAADPLAAHRQQVRTEIEKRLDGARDRLTLPDATGHTSNARPPR